MGVSINPSSVIAQRQINNKVHHEQEQDLSHVWKNVLDIVDLPVQFVAEDIQIEQIPVVDSVKFYCQEFPTN